MHPITENHASKALEWFEEHKNHPILKNQITTMRQFKKFMKNDLNFFVFSSQRCLACVGFFSALIESYDKSKDLKELLSRFKLVILDVDSSKDFYKYVVKFRPEHEPKYTWGLPLLIFGTMISKTNIPLKYISGFHYDRLNDLLIGVYNLFLATYQSVEPKSIENEKITEVYSVKDVTTHETIKN